MGGVKAQRLTVGALGFLVSAGFVALALRNLDGAALGRTLHHVRPLPWLPLAIAAYLVGQLLRGQRLRILVRRESSLPLVTASNVVVVGYASNNVLPARLGELVRVGMLAERTGIPLSQSLTVTVMERILDGIAILVLLIAGTSSLAAPPPWMATLERMASLIFGAALVVLFALVAMPRPVLALASRLSVLGSAWRDRAIAIATSVTDAVACLRTPRMALAVAYYSLLIWCFEAAMFACVLPAFSLRLALAPAAVTMAITNVGILIPSSPGFIGSFEYFCTRALQAQDVPHETALGYALIVHLAFFVPVTLWGAGVIWRYGVEIGATAALVRAARSSPASDMLERVEVRVIAQLDAEPAAPGPTAFERAVAEAVLDMPDPDRRAAAYAAAFLAEQLAALPLRLRVLAAAGIAAFRVYVRLRTLRGFCDLPLEARRRAVNAWAFGPVGLARQLFRPIRSLVLLAYWESAPGALRLLAEPERSESDGLEAHG
jgi:uncharacterized protein (TIRG00374 family)